MDAETAYRKIARKKMRKDYYYDIETADWGYNYDDISWQRKKVPSKPRVVTNTPTVSSDLKSYTGIFDIPFFDRIIGSWQRRWVSRNQVLAWQVPIVYHMMKNYDRVVKLLPYKFQKGPFIFSFEIIAGSRVGLFGVSYLNSGKEEIAFRFIIDKTGYVKAIINKHKSVTDEFIQMAGEAMGEIYFKLVGHDDDLLLSDGKKWLATSDVLSEDEKTQKALVSLKDEMENIHEAGLIDFSRGIGAVDSIQALFKSGETLTPTLYGTLDYMLIRVPGLLSQMTQLEGDDALGLRIANHIQDSFVSQAEQIKKDKKAAIEKNISSLMLPLINKD